MKWVFALSSLLILLMLFIIGCSSEQIMCQEPNVLIGNSCCLDEDSDGVCDTLDTLPVDLSALPPVKTSETSGFDDNYLNQEPSIDIIMESSASPELEFARTFESTWNKKNYNALYSMFTDDIKIKFSQQEFNFLMKRADTKLGLISVSFRDVKPESIGYMVTADEKFLVTAELSQKDGKLFHKPFYVFDDLDVTKICESDSCFVEFAKITGARNYCELAGDMRVECLEIFGAERNLLRKIDDCALIKDVYGKDECLSSLAVKEKSIEPCWSNEFDKQTYECMGKVAAIDKDPELCREYVDSRTYKGTRLQHAYCIMGYVQVTFDRTACSLIDRREDVVIGAMSENCDRLRFI